MSRARRFFATSVALPRVDLGDEEAHHILHVLRLAVGAEVQLFDGLGRSVEGVIESSHRGVVTVRVVRDLPSFESPLHLTLALAVPQEERMAFAVQKLTELGVRRIVPLLTEQGRTLRAERVETRLERWRRIVLEASKQSGRSRLMEVSRPVSLAELLADVAAPPYVAQPGAPPLRTPLPSRGAVVAAVGPEGGWSKAEQDLVRESSAVTFGLGPRTLRTETAAIAAATLLQWGAGDLAH